VAHIAAYREGAAWLDALRGYLQENMRYIARELNQAFPELNWQPPQATYLAWIDLRPLAWTIAPCKKHLLRNRRSPLCRGHLRR
jgi:cystathionine beta-lyase